MKRFFAIFVALCAAFVAVAQMEHSIIIDQKSFRSVQSDALTGVAVDAIGVDDSRRPCARIKMKINRMTREDIDNIAVKIITNNQLTKCKTAAYENGLILEMTAKPETRFYFNHPLYGESNEVTLTLEPNREYYMEASLNQTYSIVVNSNVADADIYIDDEFKGRTDASCSFTIKDVLIGSHTLKVIYGGIAHEQRIEVNSGSISFRQNVNAQASQSQYVVFSVEPQSAVVMIDNNPYSLNEGSMMVVLENGTYNYTVSAAGYHSQRGTLTVAGEKVEKIISLEADAAKVTLTAPDDAEIWINGTKRGNGSWSGTLNSGAYIFEARKAGHKSATISQKITSDRPNQSYALPAPTPIVGALTIMSTPLMADVTLDGKMVGKTPLDLNNILVGTHTLKISKSGYNVSTQTVTVAEGKKSTVNATLTKESAYTPTYSSSKNYNIGDLVTIDGVKGIVFQTSPVVKVVSVANTKASWSTDGIGTKATNKDSGTANMAAIKAISGWESKYPAFKWCAKLGEGWYLPAINELNAIYNANLELFKKFVAKNEHPYVWSSTDSDYSYAKIFNFSNRMISGCNQTYKFTIHAVKVIGETGTNMTTFALNGVTPIYIDTSLSVEALNSKGRELYSQKDYNSAVQYFYAAALKDDSFAQYILGNCYERGYGVTQDYIEAVRWYRKAAKQGDGYAQYNLGVIYYHGRGVTKNYTEAVKWYRQSAVQGNSSAQCNLGWCYIEGNGVAKNYTEAVSWFRKSAEQGNAYGQDNLGYCYENGYGVGKNMTEAIYWYKKAAAQGHSDAKGALDRLGVKY